MARMTTDRGKTLEYYLWLVFDYNGSVRIARTEPKLDRSERAMKLVCTIPKSLFNTPTLSATVTVPETVTTIPPIDLVVAADALKQAIGADIDLRLVASEVIE